MKKKYLKPEMDVVVIKQHQLLLTESQTPDYDPNRETSEFDELI